MSNYKHHNTWKTLVGISPNDILTLVSTLWTSRVPDKELTKRSGNIMTDRRFNIGDILPSGVTLNIPPLKAGRDQLNPEETDKTTRIAPVKIHVPRAIGRIKG